MKQIVINVIITLIALGCIIFTIEYANNNMKREVNTQQTEIKKEN